jgi:hypothetical protein
VVVLPESGALLFVVVVVVESVDFCVTSGDAAASAPGEVSVVVVVVVSLLVPWHPMIIVAAMEGKGRDCRERNYTLPNSHTPEHIIEFK